VVFIVVFKQVAVVAAGVMVDAPKVTVLAVDCNIVAVAEPEAPTETEVPLGDNKTVTPLV
jgi:hypothetical protein